MIPGTDAAPSGRTRDDAPDASAAKARRARFLQVASHDLRGPMANVRSYAALLTDGRTELEPRVRKSLEVILRNADRALALLREVFDSAYAEVDALEVVPERQPLRPLLEEAVTAATARCVEREVHLDATLPPELPEEIPLDRDAFRHMLSAFLDHGLARTPDGDTLRLRVDVGNGELTVEVTDPSPPPAEGEDALFDPELRAVKEGKLAPGFRLGLARLEAELHGGRVGVGPNGSGTTFFFAVPD